MNARSKVATHGHELKGTKMSIESDPFGGAKLSDEDAFAFRRAMAFTDLTSKLTAHMGRRVEPEIWVKSGDANIVKRLQSMKRARDYLEALLEFPDVVEVIAAALVLPTTYHAPGAE